MARFCAATAKNSGINPPETTCFGRFSSVVDTANVAHAPSCKSALDDTRPAAAEAECFGCSLGADVATAHEGARLSLSGEIALTPGWFGPVTQRVLRSPHCGPQSSRTHVSGAALPYPPMLFWVA
ncbi:hypothetical protein V7S43_017245 [Phytophthora oleae]|uniref:Uncharacterized protein n=1 Tax=Phytophthora oleae TaxID=2107226 RepID=A0ABD3EU83_9STRA